MRSQLSALMIVVSICLMTSLTTGWANASPIVTFFNNQASFLAAVSGPTVLDFEGITSDTSSHDFGPSYHTGAVTFTSGPSSSFPHYDIVVEGKDSQSLGVPYDSALLAPNVDPGSILATFDPGSNVTAVGGFFLELLTK